MGSYSLGYSYNRANELTGITGPSQFGSVWTGYNYDNNGRLRAIYANNVPDNVTTLANDINYRAFGAVKSMTFGDHQSLSTSYDNRMRPTSWNVSNVLGFSYTYYGGNSFGGNNQVNYAHNLSSNGGRDGTLDRSYEYDQVGALLFAHSGAEARAAFGIDGQGWGQMDGPYSLGFDYDQQGNMTHRYGWGGEVQGGTAGQTSDKWYSYSNGKNQRDGFTYDAAGNLKDGESNQHYIYNAIGQQTNAWQVNGYSIAQGYDGDGLRGVKWENEAPTYYLRSSVLGGAVVAELDASGNRTREYYYRGDQLLAVQQSGHMYWVHEDAITKSQRTTDVYGNVTSTVELDPWGANTARSSPTVFQPQTFTGYTRDGNGDSDAKARRYSVTGRFPQPDPSSGSYDLSNPQSLNRYAYVGNDPVNFRDPSGTEPNETFCGADYGWNLCGGGLGFWGGNFGNHVAEYNKEYAGMPQNIVDGLRLHQQRVDNDQGGYGFKTTSEVLSRYRWTGAHAWIDYGGVRYDAGGVVWGMYTTIYVDPVAPDYTTFRGVSFGLSSPIGIGGAVSFKVDNNGNMYLSGGPTFGLSPLVTGNYFVGETKKNGVNVTDEREVRNVLSGPSVGLTYHPTVVGGNYSWNTFKVGELPVGFLTVPLPSGTGTTNQIQFGIPEIGYSPTYTLRVPRIKAF